jgi:hypothetical protein
VRSRSLASGPGRNKIEVEEEAARRPTATLAIGLRRFVKGGCTMHGSDDSQPPDRDVAGSEDLEEDPGEELEAMIEQADRPFASESFGTTAQEEREGESFDQRLGEERPSKPPLDRQLAIEDFDAPDEEKEMVGLASFEHDRFVAPEEAAMTVRDRAPGGVDHPDDDDVSADESSDEA